MPTITGKRDKIEVCDEPDARVVVDEMPHPDLNGVDYTEAPPVRGGQRIEYVEARTATVFQCTSGFVGYTVTRTDLGIFDYAYFLLTAGHCESVDNLHALYGSALWKQVDYPVGFSDANTFGQGSDADAMRIPIKATDRSNEVSIAYQLRNLVRCEEAFNDAAIGEHVAFSSATTGGSVGGVLKIKPEIVRINDGHGGVVRLVDQREADFRSRPGDSGGSVYGSRRCAWEAMGLESGGGTRNGRVVSTYTAIAHASQAMGVSVLTS